MNVGVLVRVTERERQAWKAAADARGLSVNELVRRAVRDVLHAPQEATRAP